MTSDARHEAHERFREVLATLQLCLGRAEVALLNQQVAGRQPGQVVQVVRG